MTSPTPQDSINWATGTISTKVEMQPNKYNQLVPTPVWQRFPRGNKQVVEHMDDGKTYILDRVGPTSLRLVGVE